MTLYEKVVGELADAVKTADGMGRRGLVLASLLRAFPATLLLGVAYGVALAASLALAATPAAGGAFLAFVAVAGAAMVGSQFCLTAVVNQFYPSAIRATASGFATGAGRLGAVFAPLAGAAVMASVSQAQHALAAAAAPAAVAMLTAALLERSTSLNRSVDQGGLGRITTNNPTEGSSRDRSK